MRSPPLERSERGPLRSDRALIVGLLGAVLTLVSFALAAVPLLVPGIGFILIGMLAPIWVLAAGRGAGVTRTLHAHRVVEDEPLELTLIVRRGRLGLPGGVVSDPIAGTRIAVHEPLRLLWGARRAEIRVVTRLRLRGRHTFAPPVLTVSDPLALVEVPLVERGAIDEVLVLPRTEPVRWHGAERRSRIRGASASAAGEPTGAGELDGLRAYVPGSPASRIHWQTLARGAGLHERRLVAQAQAQPLIVLDAVAGAGPTDRERLDAAVRATASLVLELARGGGCRVLLPGMRRPLQLSRELAGWTAIHTRLALVDWAPEPPPLRVGADPGALIYVAPGPPDPSRVDALGRIGGPAILVVPHGPPAAAALGGRAQSFEVSGCAGYEISAVGSRRERGRSAAARRAAIGGAA